MNIAVIFGGRSVEHEVSVLTAHQAMAALPAKYTIVPVYIAKSGQWYTGDALRNLDNFRDLQALEAQLEPVELSLNTPSPVLTVKSAPKKRGLFGGKDEPRTISIDVAMPLIHGSHGEDGTLQGALELADIAYTGCDVSASGVAINKVLTKMLLRGVGVPVLDDLVVERIQWRKDSAGIIAAAEERFGYPLFVKPARLGSSIGVAKVNNAQELTFALDVAATYDTLLLIEPYQQGIMEINCAVLGRGSAAKASVCEQPVSQGMLSYEDKYMRGGKQQGMEGAQRIIPAPLSPELTAEIQQIALKAFAAIGAAGVVRIDFMVNPEQQRIVLNEINTLPGSLAFYLWEASDVPFPQLLETLIEQAQARHAEKRASTFGMTSNLLSNNPLQGSKTGSKVAAR